MAFNSTFGRVFSPTFQPRSVASGVEPWWLSGGIAAANCVAAYQPKGAASYEASKVNLNSPGTYDAVDGTAYPTWNATNGWMFNQSFLQYLTTGLIPIVTSYNWSLMVRYSNADTNTQYTGIAGRYVSNRYFCLLQKEYSLTGFRHGSGTLEAGQSLTSGVSGFCGNQAYQNGTNVGQISITVGASTTVPMSIGALQTGATTWSYYFTGNILALAVYDSTLTPTQVGLLTTAMNAL